MSFGTESIALASMSMSLQQVQSDVSLSLMKKTMDNAEAQATSLIRDMLQAVPPPQYTFDVLA